MSFILFKVLLKWAPTNRIFNKWKCRYNKEVISKLDELFSLTGKLAYHAERVSFLRQCNHKKVAPFYIRNRISQIGLKPVDRNYQNFIAADIHDTLDMIEKWKSWRHSLIRRVLPLLSLLDTCSLFKSLWHIKKTQTDKRRHHFKNSLMYLVRSRYGDPSSDFQVLNLTNIKTFLTMISICYVLALAIVSHQGRQTLLIL